MRYTPEVPPQDPAQMQGFLYQELLRVSASIEALADGHLDHLYVLPDKPQDGDVRYLDSSLTGITTTGIHYYNGTSWTQL